MAAYELSVSMGPTAISGAMRGNRQAIDLLLADHSNMDCELLRNALGHSRTPFNVVACAVSREEIVFSMSSFSPDIALISENLQDGPLTGIGILWELCRSFPKTKFIALLKSANDDLVVDAFRSGARGVFCRAEPLPVLHKCINAVYRGQIWADSRQLSSVLEAFVNAAPLKIVSPRGRTLLTKRENDVVKLVIEGYTNRDVAGKLGLTEHTISNYLFRIYEKLGISSRVELVLYALGEQQR